MTQSKAWKRVVVIADLHCGHRSGLTPPPWQYPDDQENALHAKYAPIQKACWDWYTREISLLRPIHLLIVNGDAIDGPGSRSGGTEQITTDRIQQVEMAERCIRQAKARNLLLVRGTPYHTGDAEDWEDLLARNLNCKIGDHEWPEVNGVVFDVKHFTQAKGLPHTRPSTAAADDLWNASWAEQDQQPRGQIVVRSHVHYYAEAGWWIGAKKHLIRVTPALQGHGSRYGSRRCMGTVNYGFIFFDIFANGDINPCERILADETQRARTSKY